MKDTNTLRLPSKEPLPRRLRKKLSLTNLSPIKKPRLRKLNQLNNLWLSNLKPKPKKNLPRFRKRPSLTSLTSQIRQSNQLNNL